MAQIQRMPPIRIEQTALKRFGRQWIKNGENLKRTPPQSSIQFGLLFDNAVSKALAIMLGNIPIVVPNANSLTPSKPDCVEIGPVRLVGGVRPQNFDVGYRPDGPRFAFDSKTLNDSKSLGKNFLNMINDLATEATTVHTRFPHAIVAFMFIVPKPCLEKQNRRSITALQTLDRLARRVAINDPEHMAEAIAVVVWNPQDGSIDKTTPSQSSLRIENFSSCVEKIYKMRYEGLPPHGVIEEIEENAF